MTKNEDFKVREASLDDVTTLVAFRHDLQEHMVEGNPYLFDMAPEWRESKQAFYTGCIGDPLRHLVVGCAGTTSIVGMGLGSIVQNADLRPATFGSIDDVWITPASRRRGYGTLIFERLTSFFIERGIEDLTLTYAVGNPEAERFWSALGFQPVLVVANRRSKQ